jgi:hypothetical protein
MISTLSAFSIGTAKPAQPILWLCAMITLHAAVVFGVETYFGLSSSSMILAILAAVMTGFFPLFLLAALIVKFVHLAAVQQHPRPAQALLAQVRTYFSDKAAVLDSLLALGFLIIFIDAFTRLKGMIPHIHPFSWDMSLAQFDRALHAGVDPWIWLHPITQYAAVMKVLDVSYIAWFLVLYFAVFFALFARGKTQNRHAFLIAFVFIWAIGGNGVAMIFSSAGPVFFAQIGMGDMFAPLNDHLTQINQAMPLASHLIKQTLWAGYAQGGEIASISAFPSMHVGSTALIMLFAFSYRPWVGWIMAGFLVVILVGSVSLAWHYAADGYAGILLAWAAWRAGLWVAARA